MRKEEIQLIDSIIKNLFNQLKSLFDYGRYSNKANLSVMIDQFHSECREFPNTFISKIQKISPSSYLIDKLNSFLDDVDFELSNIDNKNVPDRFLVASNGKWSAIRADISDYITELTLETFKEKAFSNISPHSVSLNRSQIALLMLNLREVGAVSKDLTDKQLSTAFSLLSGYSDEKLRQSISGIAKSEKNQITHVKDNFDKLKELLEQIILRIDKDIEESGLT
ncbi:MAG: hypothetical protein ACTSW1_08980 [Candidatus Hodarchaeales archaeon]